MKSMSQLSLSLCRLREPGRSPSWGTAGLEPQCHAVEQSGAPAARVTHGKQMPGAAYSGFPLCRRRSFASFALWRIAKQRNGTPSCPRFPSPRDHHSLVIILTQQSEFSSISLVSYRITPLQLEACPPTRRRSSPLRTRPSLPRKVRNLGTILPPFSSATQTMSPRPNRPTSV